jgi:hypothetical protein
VEVTINVDAGLRVSITARVPATGVEKRIELAEAIRAPLLEAVSMTTDLPVPLDLCKACAVYHRAGVHACGSAASPSARTS